MTVVEVDGFEIACRWFECAAVKEGTFPVHMIAKEAQSEAVMRPKLGHSATPDRRSSGAPRSGCVTAR
jgi:hypothetical protein